jgi:membrane protease YdiL (CAAX protease family)
MPVWEETRANLLAWLLLAVSSALPVLSLWFFLGTKRLLPPQRVRLAPWNGYEVFLVFLSTQPLVRLLLSQLLNRIGFFNWLYGPGFADQKLADARRGLWELTFAFPLQLAGTFIILRSLSGTRLYQLGLATAGTARNALMGWLAWLLLAPPVLLLNILVLWCYWVWKGAPAKDHPLTQLAQAQPSSIEWILIIVSSVFLAPVLEELLFRRVLQGWSARRPWGGPITLAAAFALSTGASHDWEPALFVLIMAPGCFLGEDLFRRWLPLPYSARAIYSSALLFAVLHPWPTPVPLFMLGLGLGYLACRTQNLVAPIVCHAFFNGVACVVMLLSSYTEPANGRETTSAVRRPPSASTSRIVPGSWLPRRTYASAIACPSLGETTEDVTLPTSLPAWKSLAPGDTAPFPASFNPMSDRFTWP